MYQNNTLINRYPICSLWYYCVAKHLGYTDKQAKTMAIARATFFAAAKGWGFKSQKKSSQSIKTFQDKLDKQPNFEAVNFAGLSMYLDMADGLAWFGDKKIKPEEFESKVELKIHKIDPNYFIQLLDYMDNLISKYTKQELNSSLAYKLYERFRDEVREPEFLQKKVA